MKIFLNSKISKIVTGLFIFSFIFQLFAPVLVYASGDPSCDANSDGGVSTDYGGVTLDQAATFLADMSDIVGSYYDEARNQIVFVGKKNSTLPQFDKDDLAVAIRSVIFNNTNPSVSIDFKDLNNITAYSNMDVKYYGGIEDTNFGKVLFEADYDLKRYMVGSYDANGTPVSSSVPGYKSVLRRFTEYGPNPNTSSASRWWISPQEITLKRDDTNDSFVFDTVKMQVQTAPLKTGNDPAWDKAAVDFAVHQTQYYDQYATETPSYAKAKQLGKIVGVIKWIKDNQVATDYEWVKDYTPVFVQTPREVPRITSPNVYSGNYYYYMTGGVSYSTPNTYQSDTQNISSQIKNASSGAFSNSQDGISWSFSLNNESYDSVAVSADIFKSVGAYTYSATDMSLPTTLKYPLSFTRSYSSFNSDKNVGFGYGWDTGVLTLSDASYGSYTYSYPSGGYHGQYPYRLAVMTPSGRETFTFNNASYIADEKTFFSKLTREENGNFVLTTKDRIIYKFKGTGNYKPSYRLESVSDINSQNVSKFIQFEYSSDGRIFRISESNNGYQEQQINFTYDNLRQLIQISAPGFTVNYDYDSNGDLISVSDKKANLTRYSYIPGHLLQKITDRSGSRLVENTYDQDKKLISQIGSNGLVKRTVYDKENKSVLFTDTNGRDSYVFYDEKIRPIRSVSPDGTDIRYSYAESSDAPSSVINALGQTQNIVYDDRGNPVSLEFPDGGKIKNKWYEDLILETKDERYINTKGFAKLTKFSYDSNRNLIKTSVSGTTKDMTYLSNGLVYSVTDQSGMATRFNYDTKGQMISSTDHLGNSINYKYDIMGRMIEKKDQNGFATQIAYDRNGNKISETDSYGMTSYEYDVNDRLVSATNPLGQITEFTYNSAGNLSFIKDSIGGVTSYSYDSYGNIIRIVDALGRETTMLYDNMNREISYTTPSGKVWTTSYDALDNVASKTFPNGIVENFTYDLMNRLTSKKITNGSGSVITYTYDSAGRMTKAEDRFTGVTTFVYDIKDRLAETTDSSGNKITYTYNAADDLSKIIYPNGKTVQYQYDALHRLIKQTDWNKAKGITTYSYTPTGAVKEIIYPNKLKQVRMYDALDRLKSFEYLNSSDVSLFKQTFTRNTLGYMTRILETKSGQDKNYDYEYDALGRLTEVSGSSRQTISYSYDAVGNMVSSKVVTPVTNPPVGGKKFETVTTTNTFNPDNQLIRSKTFDGVTNKIAEFVYNKFGSLISKTIEENVKTFSWLDGLTLTEVKNGSDTPTNFSYDALGNRISKSNTTTNPTITKYVNDILAPNHLVLVEKPYNSTDKLNVWGRAGLISTGGADPNGRVYPLTDSQGTTRFLTDSKGKIIENHTYDPFGNKTNDIIPSTPYLYTGENYDTETGLYYLRARYYDPSTNRFISRDPVRGTLDNPQSQNAYPYSLNNPVNFSDPSGRSPLLLALLGLFFLDPIIGSPSGDLNPCPEDFESARNKEFAFFMASMFIPGGQGTQGEKAIIKALSDKNKFVHLFDNAQHGLAPLVEKLGGQENTILEVVKATLGKLPNNGRIGEVTVDVGGFLVNVRGRVVDGIERIGTFFIR